MDIGIYHPWLKEKGGAEKVILEASKRSSHNVRIFTRYYEPEETFSGFKDLDVKQIGSAKKSGGFVKKIVNFELASALTDLEITDLDALVVSTSGIGTSITLRNHDSALVSYTHTPLRAILPEFKSSYKKEVNPYLRPFYGLAAKFLGFLEELSYSYFDKVIANSRNTKERIIERRLAVEQEIEVINPGVDIEKSSELSESIGSSEKYFLYPSRFRRYKRQELAIKSFKRASIEDFKLILAGSGQEEEYIEELKKLSGNDGSVEIKTDVSEDEWEKLHEEAYAGIFLAKNEDWGIAPLEMMSYGKPVISVNEGGPREQIVDGETGFLVEASEKSIRDKIEFLINSPEERDSMGKKARKRAKKFSWENFSTKFDKSIKEAVNSHG